MRNIYLTFALLLIVQIGVNAQNFIPFQGIALDGSGKALASKKIGIKISILKDGALGSVSYAESHAPTTDNNGLFQINIGSGAALTNTFTAIDWSTLNYFLKLEMDITGGSNYALISTTKLGFVPFALYSTRSQNPAIYQNIGNAADTLKIDDNVTICETQDGSWRRVFKLPQPTALNGQLTNRRNTTILFNCKSTLSIIVSKLNSNLRDDLEVSKGEYVLFFFDGEKWVYFGGKTPQNDIKNNTYFGQNSLLKLTTANYNTAVGSSTLEQITTGSWNTAVGVQALRNNTIGIANVAIGQGSLYTNLTGSQNVAIGRESLFSSDLSSSNNVGIGDRSLQKNINGNNNTAIGSISGIANKSGSNNIFLGYNSQSSTENASNEITFGDSNIKTIRSAVTSITSLSDARDKKNIQDLNLGLNFIQTLKPRSFQWDKREWYTGNTSDGSKIAKISTAGFIAQELDESQQKFNADWLNLVYKSNPEKLEANYGNLTPIIVKAIQELSDANKALREENKAIKIEIEKLKNK